MRRSVISSQAAFELQHTSTQFVVDCTISRIAATKVLVFPVPIREKNINNNNQSQSICANQRIEKSQLKLTGWSKKKERKFTISLFDNVIYSYFLFFIQGFRKITHEIVLGTNSIVIFITARNLF